MWNILHTDMHSHEYALNEREIKPNLSKIF